MAISSNPTPEQQLLTNLCDQLADLTEEVENLWAYVDHLNGHCPEHVQITDADTIRRFTELDADHWQAIQRGSDTYDFAATAGIPLAGIHTILGTPDTGQAAA